MKKIIDIQDKNLAPDDIIVYDGKQWITVKKDYFLGELKNKNIILENQIKELKNQINELKKDVSNLASILKGVI